MPDNEKKSVTAEAPAVGLTTEVGEVTPEIWQPLAFVHLHSALCRVQSAIGNCHRGEPRR